MKRIHPAIEKTSDKTYSPPGFKTFAAKIRWEGHTIITEKYAINATPLQYFSEADLIYRYVAALILFDKDMPNSLDDVESIGIFKNYVDAYFEKSGAEEDEFFEDLRETCNIAKRAFEKIKDW